MNQEDAANSRRQEVLKEINALSEEMRQSELQYKKNIEEIDEGRKVVRRRILISILLLSVVCIKVLLYCYYLSKKPKESDSKDDKSDKINKNSKDKPAACKPESESMFADFSDFALSAFLAIPG